MGERVCQSVIALPLLLGMNFKATGLALEFSKQVNVRGPLVTVVVDFREGYSGSSVLPTLFSTSVMASHK